LLILGRRINQSIVFPNCGITVRLLDLNGKVAKIGIEAPQSVEIKRGELLLQAPQSNASNSYESAEKCGGFERNDEPEFKSPVLQFAQRLSEIRAGLHLFQQRRAAGDEVGADQVFGDLLNEIANLDADALKSVPLTSVRSKTAKIEFISENMPEYNFNQRAEPVHVLIVNEQNDCNGFDLPVGMFHGCQICTVNNHRTATCAISSSEPFDYVICNGVSAFDELELVRTIRSDRRLDTTRVFITSDSSNTKELLELSKSYRIDGWLGRPLLPQDLWKHIVESQQIES
jgi:carbon storage regulator CsrA